MTTKILAGSYTGVFNLVAPVTTPRRGIAATGYLQAGLMSAGVNTYTIVNNGGIHGTTYGISLAGGGVVTNAALITNSVSTTTGEGIVLGSGGKVTNDAGASIIGYYGVVVKGQAGTVNNQGLIQGGGKYGVELTKGGLLTNGATTDTTATLRGGTAGLWAGVSSTVRNFGTIVSNGTSGVGAYFKAGGLVNNGSASDTTAIVQGSHIGVEVLAGSGTVISYGTVQGVGTASVAIALEAGGVVTNGSASDTTALMSGSAAGVAFIGLAGTLNNFGTVLGGYNLGSAFGAYMKNGGVVNNGSAKDTVAHIGGAVDIAVFGAAGTINNFGALGGLGAEIGVIVEYGGVIANGAATDTTAVIQAYVGVGVANHAGTVLNFGTILAGGGSTALTAPESGVLLQAGGSVTNGSSADTKALIEGGTFGVYGQTISATVTNFGAMSGTEAGVLLQVGGKITNGSATDTTATVSGSLIGAAVEGAVGTVSNFGTIISGPFRGIGVALTAGGVITNGSATDHAALIEGFEAIGAESVKVTNSGTILGLNVGASYGADIGSNSALTNNAGALIAGYNGVDAFGRSCPP